MDHTYIPRSIHTYLVPRAGGLAHSSVLIFLGPVAVEVRAAGDVAPALVAVLGCRVRRAFLVAVGHTKLA